MKNHIVALSAFVVLGLCLSRVVDGQSEKLLPKARPLAVLSGRESHVKKPTYLRITSTNELTRVWASHSGPSWDANYGEQVEVDFDRCMVVTILRGERINVRGIKIHSVLTAGNAVVVRFEDIGYQTARAANDTSPERPPDRPYAFVVLPRTDNAIVLEENIQDLKGEPPVWKECARLKAITPQSTAEPAK